MFTTIGSVGKDRFEELVTSSLDRVEMEARCQFAVGDAALEIEPLRPHGGHLPVAEPQLSVEESLALFAARLGVSFHTVRTQRWVAAQWPAEHRQTGVSFEVHRILAAHPDRFELIRNPPLNERTGLPRWTGEAAKKAVGWKSDQVPVSTAEKVAAIRDLAEGDEAVAAVVATDFLRRPDVAFKAMRDPTARERVNEAQFELAEEGGEDDEFTQDYVQTFSDEDEGDPIEDPVHIVRGFRKAQEFGDLIAVCQGFIAGAARLVPKLRCHDLTASQVAALTRHVEKLRATTDWIEHAVATGKVDLDEQLAQLLRGQ
ncbi:DUF6192 family protein [Streptomyces poonensis]|uniref:RacO protein n=1 Tax=Streptomyces poonensis TaxID=68255 RepID=A0A918QGU1_9ACTN|nr:DUF6192 family protein [Streptomyces poonensis]GGZ44706.1 hypothetical protein GCM10010365_76270 [Streptomyces poonensis]